MPRAWLCIPSARPAEDSTVNQWLEAGYGVALWKDGPGPIFERDRPRILIQHPVYPGYAQAVNRLVAMVLEYDQAADFVVVGGDDIEPDHTHSLIDITESIIDHFGGTFGICQPTGDRSFGDKQGPYIDRVAGSAWIGREFALRAYGGNGPLWPEFSHMFVDEHLRAIAVKLGTYWERPDLTQLHQHWGRPREGETMGQADRMPEHLVKWNTPEHWCESKAIFDRLKAAGFAEADGWK